MDYCIYHDHYALPTTSTVVSENPPVVDIFEVAALNEPRLKERLTGREAKQHIDDLNREAEYALEDARSLEEESIRSRKEAGNW